ncbi:MAG: AAA family ATPase [Myxococcales bacterium]|nr:AAA family ATPase [Myxococcales bacterium]MCB9582565.1 AAA family ATPase [Polyangiaceae bacterium]
MTRRIAISSQKGGTGKTTISLNLALSMAERGTRTLLVDLDPQGGIGHSLSRGDTDLVGLADVLMGACSPGEAVLETKLAMLSLLPRGRLDAVDACEFEQALLRPGVLAEALEAVEKPFDVVILDTPSGVGMPTRAALAVSHFALVPVQGEPLSLRSIGQMLRVIEHVKGKENPNLQLLGILPTMVERQNEASLNVLITAWRELGGVLETVIPRADVFAKASEAGLPLAYLGGKPSPEANRFGMLATEVQSLMADLGGEEEQYVERPARQLL